ncbi:MAG: divalent-cation tolerance protein CutA [Pseudomonadota bacterium]
MAEEIVTLYVTCADEEEAARLAHALIEARLAACGNVVPNITSIYRWAGKIEKAREVALLLKTRAALITPASARIRALHSYETPCIVAWPVMGGDAAYADWVRAETAGGEQ